MYFTFEPAKAVQAAAVLLRAAIAQRMSYLRLLKLLYVADRAHLAKTGRPIIGARMVALDNGPMHSGIYDLIKGTHPEEQIWSAAIHNNRYEVELVNDPGVLELSRSEIDTLNQAADSHCNDSEWELVALTQSYPEWSKNYIPQSAHPIPLEDMLDALNFSAGDKAAIIEELRDAAAQDRMLAGRELKPTP